MNCQVCLENFNTLDHKPYALIPCGHSFCLKCLNNLIEQFCPKCRKEINEKILNYAIIDILDMKLFSIVQHSNISLVRRSVNNYGYIEWKMEDKPKIIKKIIDGN